MGALRSLERLSWRVEWHLKSKPLAISEMAVETVFLAIPQMAVKTGISMGSGFYLILLLGFALLLLCA